MRRVLTPSAEVGAAPFPFLSSSSPSPPTHMAAVTSGPLLTGNMPWTQTLAEIFADVKERRARPCPAPSPPRPAPPLPFFSSIFLLLFHSISYSIFFIFFPECCPMRLSLGGFSSLPLSPPSSSSSSSSSPPPPFPHPPGTTLSCTHQRRDSSNSYALLPKPPALLAEEEISPTSSSETSFLLPCLFSFFLSIDHNTIFSLLLS